VEGHTSLVAASTTPVDLPRIRFCLVPAAQGDFTITAHTRTTMLRVYLP